MGDPTIWSTLPKTIDDLTTIIEQIAADILTHNQDPSAHGQSGEVVETHRSADEIDHSQGTMPIELFSWKNEFYFTFWDSIDGWSAPDGGVDVAPFGMQIQTGLVINTERTLIAVPYGFVPVDWDKELLFQVCVKLSAITDQLIYFVSGGITPGVESYCFGFKVVDGTLYALDRNNLVEHTTVIAGITLTNANVYRAINDPVEGEIRFYVNGVLEATHNVNLPTTDESKMMKFYIKNTAAANKLLYASYALFQKKP